MKLSGFLFFAFFSTQHNAWASPVKGNIDGVSNNGSGVSIFGWACDSFVNASTNVHLYVGGPAGTGQVLKSTPANLPGEIDISKACGTFGIPHRFKFNLTASEWTQNQGRLIYIHGISLKGPEHLLIGGSGSFSIPGANTSSCQITVPSCPAYPHVRGIIDDDYEGSKTNSNRCLRRVDEYSSWCQTPDLITAKFFMNQKLVATNTSTACEVSIAECPKSPGTVGTFFDNYFNAKTDSEACMQRASNYLNWCGSTAPAIAKFFSNGKIQRAEFSSPTNHGFQRKILNVQQSTNALAIYVNAQTGNDGHAGTIARPLRTIERAQQMVRNLKSAREIIVYLEGHFNLTAPLTFNSKDSGSAEATITYVNRPGAKAQISGGISLNSKWTVAPSNPKVYQLPTGNIRFRNLFINGQRANLAKSANFDSSIILPTKEINCQNCHELQRPLAPQTVEVVVMLQWQTARCQAVIDTNKLITPHVSCLPLLQKISSDHRVPGHVTRIENGLINIKNPGDFAFDLSEQKIYYYPRQNEDLNNADVSVDGITQLILAENLSHVTFSGITFEQSSWNQGNTPDGFKTIQVDVYAPYYKLIPAAFECRTCVNVVISNNTFKNIGGAGIFIGQGSQNSVLSFNQFSDLGGSGIQISGSQVHPFDSLPTKGLVVQDNSFERIGLFNLGSTAIFQLYASSSFIGNNSLSHLPYSGISVGWGWSADFNVNNMNNLIIANSITDAMQVLQDGAGIYTLSRQDGTLIKNNWIRDIHDGDPSISWLARNSNGIYLDNGSSGIQVEQNVIERVPYKTIYENKDPSNPAFDNQISESILFKELIQEMSGARESNNNGK